MKHELQFCPRPSCVVDALVLVVGCRLPDHKYNLLSRRGTCRIPSLLSFRQSEWKYLLHVAVCLIITHICWTVLTAEVLLCYFFVIHNCVYYVSLSEGGVFDFIYSMLYMVGQNIKQLLVCQVMLKCVLIKLVFVRFECNAQGYNILDLLLGRITILCT